MILRPSIRRAPARVPRALGGARQTLMLLAAVGISGWLPARAQASHLLVSSDNAILSFSETTGAFSGTLVPSGSGGLTRSQGLASGPDGNLYVSSQDTQSVLRFNSRTGAFIDAFVPAGTGGLSLPMGLAFGPDGNLYVSSFGSGSILRYDGRTGAFIDVFVPTGGALDSPTGLTFGPDGNLYVGNAASNAVLRFDGRTGAFIDTFAFTRSSGLYAPVNPVFGPDGSLYVNSYYTNAVLRFDGGTGAPLGEFVRASTGGLSGPASLVFGPDANLYVASADTDSILRYNGMTGAFLSAFVPQGQGGLHSPTWLMFTPPYAPSALKPTVVSKTQIRLTWTDNSDDEDAFAVWRKSPGIAGGSDYQRIGLVAPNVTTFLDSGLTPNVTYTYRVRATHGSYPSPWSNEVSATPQPVPPAAPTGLVVKTGAAHQLILTWTDNSSTETAYAVWRKSGQTDYIRIASLPANTTHYTDTGLSAKTTYLYRVRAINNDGASDWSNTASGTTLP